jgi:hypothetical protein
LGDEKRLDILQKYREKRAHSGVSDGDAFGAVFGTHPAHIAVVQAEKSHAVDDDRRLKELLFQHGAFEDSVELAVTADGRLGAEGTGSQSAGRGGREKTTSVSLHQISNSAHVSGGERYVNGGSRLRGG